MQSPKLKFIDYRQYNEPKNKKHVSHQKLLKALDAETNNFENLTTEITMNSTTFDRETLDVSQSKQLNEQTSNNEMFQSLNDTTSDQNITQESFLPVINDKKGNKVSPGFKIKKITEMLEKLNLLKKEQELKKENAINVEWQPFQVKNSLMLQAQIRQQKTKLKQFKNMKPILGQTDQKLTQNQMKDDALQYIILREEVKILSSKIRMFMIKTQQKGILHFKNTSLKKQSLFNERLEQTILMMKEIDNIIKGQFTDDQLENQFNLAKNVFDESETLQGNLIQLNEKIQSINQSMLEFDFALKLQKRKYLGKFESKKVFFLIAKVKYNLTGLTDEFVFYACNQDEKNKWIKKLSKISDFKNTVDSAAKESTCQSLKVLNKKIKQSEIDTIFRKISAQADTESFIQEKLKQKYISTQRKNKDSDFAASFTSRVNMPEGYRNFSNVHQFIRENIEEMHQEKMKLIRQKTFMSRNLEQIEVEEIKNAYNIGLNICSDRVHQAIIRSFV